MSSRTFEPFIDYEAVSPEQARDVQRVLRVYRDAVDALADAPEGIDITSLAACVLSASAAASQTINQTMRELHRVPVMVHIAGKPGEESNPDDAEQTGVIQRCVRCGSILHLWLEDMGIIDPVLGARMIGVDDVPWWNEGEIVAKANSPTGVGMYAIEPQDRQLLEHEHECADLSGLDAPES